MLDDTCYYLSFNDLRDAFYTWVLLNTDNVKNFLSSVVFLDSKRPYTKEILMRIDILRLVENTKFDNLLKDCQESLRGFIEYEPDEKDLLTFQDSLSKIELQPVFNEVL